MENGGEAPVGAATCVFTVGADDPGGPKLGNDYHPGRVDGER